MTNFDEACAAAATVLVRCTSDVARCRACECITARALLAVRAALDEADGYEAEYDTRSAIARKLEGIGG